MSLIHRGALRQYCPINDEDLLMYLHNELPALRRQRIKMHLRHCSACRERLIEFAQVSTALAGAIRGDQLPDWKLPRSSDGWLKKGLLPRLPIILLALTVLFFATSYYNRESEDSWPGARIVKGIADACDLDIQRAFSQDKKEASTASSP